MLGRIMTAAEGQHGGGPLPQAFKDFLNSAFNPIVYTCLSVGLFIVMLVAYRTWTKPKFAFEKGRVVKNGWRYSADKQ